MHVVLLVVFSLYVYFTLSSKSRDTFRVHFVPMVLPSCSHAHAFPDLGTAAVVYCRCV